LTSAHSDHRLVQPTIWTCDDAADRSPSKSDGVVDLSVQHGHQLHAVLYHPLAPVFAGSRSHRLVFHKPRTLCRLKEASHERGSVAFPPSDCSVVDSLPIYPYEPKGYQRDNFNKKRLRQEDKFHTNIERFYLHFSFFVLCFQLSGYIFQDRLQPL